MIINKKDKGPIFGVRHLQTILLFFSIVVVYAGRLNVSIALVAMTDSATTNPDFPEFNWNEKQRSYILSSFFWGYVVTQFPGAYLARKFGVKACILISVLGSSLCNTVTPIWLPWGQWQVFCVIRVVQGIFQGVMFPCIHAHLATWSPIEERTRLGGISHLGIEIGTIIAMSVTGIIAASSLGWPGISYVYGGIGIGFCILWLLLAENNPTNSRLITVKEKSYILSSQSESKSKFEEKKIPVPWKAIFTSVPFLSLVTCRLFNAWGSSTMHSQIPAYLHGVLNMKIKSNALFSTLPYISQLVFALLFLFIFEYIQKKQWTSLDVARKTFNTIAMWGPAALLIGIGFLGANHKALAIVLLTLNVGLNGGSTVGSLLNTIDLSPNHAGTLTGIMNGVPNCVPIVSPLVVGVIVYDETQRALWQIIFIIAAVLFFFGNLQFIFFGTTKTQPWNDEQFSVKRPVKSMQNGLLNTL